MNYLLREKKTSGYPKAVQVALGLILLCVLYTGLRAFYLYELNTPDQPEKSAPRDIAVSQSYRPFDCAMNLAMFSAHNRK